MNADTALIRFVTIRSDPGGQLVQPISTVTVVVSYSFLLTGLTGGSNFYVRCVYYNELGNTGVASARNVCNLDAMVTFLH